MMLSSGASIAAALAALLAAAVVNVNLLRNGSFDDGMVGEAPAYWRRFGEGVAFLVADDGCISGDRCVVVGMERLGIFVTLLAQAVPGEQGKVYTVKGSSLAKEGKAMGELKIDFRTQFGVSVQEWKLPFTAGVRWTAFSLTVGPAPPGTSNVVVSVVGY
eukprot:Selendium_serpulae@DN11136_c0_g1_i1.p1